MVVVGPTASGKSALGIALAERRGDAEIVSVDSMQVYRGMDIGTAKATPEERSRVRHHLLDLLDPDEECSVAWFQAEARAVLDRLEARGRRPILVGGTGLYHRAVVDGLEIPGRYPEVAAGLEAEPDTAALHRRLAGLDPTGAARMEPTNRRRVLRALEVTVGSGRPFSSFGPGLDAYPATRWRLVGLAVDRDLSAERIAARVHAMVDAGLVDEVARLIARPAGLSRTARQALGYREVIEHLEGRCSLEEAVELTIVRTRRFAARQERWFRRDPRIEWFDAGSPDLVDRVAGTVERT